MVIGPTGNATPAAGVTNATSARARDAKEVRRAKEKRMLSESAADALIRVL